MFVSHAYFYSFSFFSDNIHFSMSIVNYTDHNHSGFREIIIFLFKASKSSRLKY